MGIAKSRPNFRRRNVLPEMNQPELATPILITATNKSGSVLTLTFNSVVSLDRGVVPQITTSVAGAEPVSAEQTAPNAVAITYDVAIASATTLTIPDRDPAIRNASGGFVISNMFPLAA